MSGNRNTGHCPVPWCPGWHDEGDVHFAPVVDFEMTGNVDIAIYISDAERSGLRVTVDLHVGNEEGGLQLEIGPGRAYAFAQILAALDPAAVLQFAERLSFAAVTLDPSVSGEVTK